MGAVFCFQEERVDREPLDFTMVVGLFSHRDEDIYTMPADDKYQECFSEPVYTIATAEAPSKAEWCLNGRQKVITLLERLAKISEDLPPMAEDPGAESELEDPELAKPLDNALEAFAEIHSLAQAKVTVEIPAI